MGMDKKSMDQAVKAAAAEARGEVPKGTAKKLVTKINNSKATMKPSHKSGKRGCK